MGSYRRQTFTTFVFLCITTENYRGKNNFLSLTKVACRIRYTYDIIDRGQFRAIKLYIRFIQIFRNDFTGAVKNQQNCSRYEFVHSEK